MINNYIIYALKNEVLNHNYYLANSILTEMNRIKEVLDKSYNMVNAYVQNRQQPRLEVLNDTANILDVDVKDLIVSSKK